VTAQIVTGSVEGGDKLEKYLRTLALRLGAGGEAVIGFLEGKTYDTEHGGLPVAQVAFWQEYGTTTIPSRPFFRNMIEDQMPTWARKLGIAARMSQYRPKQTLEIVAADIKGHLVESINLLMDPPLSLVTSEAKGFPKPLIDTGTMVDSPAWVVRTGAPVRA
jgi:hypothetical protein